MYVALAKKLKNMSLSQMFSVAKNCYSEIATDMSVNQILGYALVNSRLLLNGRGVASSISRQTMESYEVLPKQLDGIVNQLKLTKGADIAIFMYELENGSYKVSLRSTEAVDVSCVAGRFGGGGHARAAGVNMSGTVDEILENLLPVIEEQL